MLHRIDLCFNHKPRVGLFSEIVFGSGLNVVAGPNGSGKSTLLKAIHRCNDCKREETAVTRYAYFDAETMNPHREETRLPDFHGAIIRSRSLFSSHGETMRDVLGSVAFDSGDCLLLDEPESGQDLLWIIKIRSGIDAIADRGCQVIVASHHPVFWKGSKLIELVPGYVAESRSTYKTWL
ncbi:MAG: AAA family ATPase [Deltaproteobacteria bacterium]|nr:AAA family ATPase [Deltaproteobacteria bacterium]